MALRYELKDRERPRTERGHRFATVERALRALREAHPRGRWYVLDRETGQEMNA